ncbi:MAG TPA: Crp/Fnr family transcriptional regulator [Gammaproteobacteria bacterium]|nr:Crp/Fnr family transcriptional regulator [Gammaproteobacteria bacterium]
MLMNTPRSVNGKHSRIYTKCTTCPIRKMALFQGVPFYRLEWTQRFRESQQNVEARKQIYLEQTPPTHAYTLFSGWVALYKTLDNGKRQILRIALPGDMLGFQVAGDGTATHSAEALTQVKLCTFPRSTIPTMLREQPEIASRLVEMSSRDMAICQQHLVCTGKKDARQRLAYLLAETFHRVRRQTPADYDAETNSIFFPITQEDLGDTVGLTNVHVNRTLKQMENEGILRCRQRRLEILDEDRLTEIGQFDKNVLEIHPLIDI